MINFCININKTIDIYGYNPIDLKKYSQKMVFWICDSCNIENVKKFRYANISKICKKCSNKINSINGAEKRSNIIKNKIKNGTYIPPMLGKKHKKETIDNHIKRIKGKTYEQLYGKDKAYKMKKDMSNRNSGKNNPFFGMTHSEITIKKMSEIQKKISKKGKDCNFYGKNYNKILSTNDFIDKSNKVHNNVYDYSITHYVGSNKHVYIICKVHGCFKQISNTHLSGCGCPKCNRSKGEIKISNFLNKNKINFVEQYKFNECFNKSKLIFDFYLPDKNICIEYDGEFHYKDLGFNNLEYQLNNDNIKNNFCKLNNIDLIRISYEKFNDIDEILTILLKI